MARWIQRRPSPRCPRDCQNHQSLPASCSATAGSWSSDQMSASRRLLCSSCRRSIQRYASGPQRRVSASRTRSRNASAWRRWYSLRSPAASSCSSPNSRSVSRMTNRAAASDARSDSTILLSTNEAIASKSSSESRGCAASPISAADASMVAAWSRSNPRQKRSDAGTPPGVRGQQIGRNQAMASRIRLQPGGACRADHRCAIAADWKGEPAAPAGTRLGAGAASSIASGSPSSTCDKSRQRPRRSDRSVETVAAPLGHDRRRGPRRVIRQLIRGNLAGRPEATAGAPADIRVRR